MFEANMERGDADSTANETSRIGHDFSQIPVHAPAQGNIQPQLKANLPGAQLPNPPQGQFLFSETKAQLEGDRGNSDNRNGIPDPLKAGLEALSGFDLSDIRVHRNSPKPAALNALAYAQGQEIHLGPGYDQHLPHEGWHVVQQRQGRVQRQNIGLGNIAINVDPRLESEADRMGKQALDPVLAHRHESLQRNVHTASLSNPPVQLKVRTNGGAQHVNEAYYQTGGGKSIGNKHSVATLIGDGVRRVFVNSAELEDFANGKTDYIGDVVTQAAGTFWYRLPKTKLTVLGEIHENPKGNVQDVILALQTSRFMYEPFNELVNVNALNIPFTGTQSRLTQINAGQRVGGLVNRATFSPDLENIVIKALTGASITRNEFISANPSAMNAQDQKQWGRRASTNDYSYGERTALYLSMGIHLASDISKQNFGPPNLVESLFISSARALKDFYLLNQSVLDTFMRAKDSDDLIGIYELTAPNNFQNLPVIKDFTLVLHEYASRYIEQLGAESGNKKLEAEGQALAGNLGATLGTLSPAREEIMWEKIQQAVSKGYLIVGMGDAHRTSLEPRLNKAGIPHEEVEQSLKRQKVAVDAGWKP
jgi:Domain of unknown function (DUF4157)